MRSRILPLLFGCAITGAGGCAGGTNSQLTTCQAEKEQLLATIRTQRDSNKALGEQIASLESRLDQAEKSLAQGPASPRFSQAAERAPTPGKAPTAGKAATSSKAATLSRQASLSWRSPDEKPPAANPSGSGTASASKNLAELARLDERVKLDRAAGIARIEMPLAFQNQSATLTAEDKRRLDDVARLLKSKEAKELQIVVAGAAGSGRGQNERAQAVVDYLDRHGIARERLQMGEAAEQGKVGGAGLVLMEIVGGGTPVAGLPAASGERRR